MTTLTLVPQTPTANGYTPEPTPEPIALDYDFVFRMLVQCEGHILLARELIAKHYQVPTASITNLHVIEAVRDRLPELKQYMEALSVLELFSLMPVMSKTLAASMTSYAQDPADAINAFMSLHKLISAKVDTQKIDVNIMNEYAWKNIPQELRQLWLISETQNDEQQTG